MKKTKLIGTIQTDIEIEDVGYFIEEGVDAIYIPWRVVTKTFIDAITTKVDEINHKLDRNVSIIMEVEGPRVCTGSFIGGSAFYKSGDKIRVYVDDTIGDSTKFSVSYSKLIEEVRTNTVIKVGSSLVAFQVLEKGIDYLLCEVTSGGMITDKSTVTILDTTLSLPFMSSKDKEMISYASEKKVDYLSLSMVHSSEDVLCINDLLISIANDTTGILVKIDNEKAMDDVDEIMKVCDGIIVSREELAAEFATEKIPAMQKSLIQKCHTLGKISIVPLELFSRNSKPNQAEVSDMTSSILEGCDSLLLDMSYFVNDSEKQISMVSSVIESLETDVNYYELLDRSMQTESQNTTGWIAYSVTECALRLKVKAIVAPTMSGYTAKKMSRFRPICPIVAMTPDIAVAKSLSLYYGVYVVVEKNIKTFDSMMDISREVVWKLNMVTTHDKFIITGGYPFKNVKYTNFMKIEEI